MGHKKIQRTAEYQTQVRKFLIREAFVNDLEQCNFNKLLHNGIIVEAKQEKELLTIAV